MAKLTLNKRLGLEYTPENVDAAKIALILIDIWDKHWCSSIAKQTNQLAKQVKALLPLIRNNGVLIIHSPSDCHNYYDPENPQAPPEVIARRKAFIESPFLKGVGVDPSTTLVFPPKLTPRYNRLDPLKNKTCPEGDTIVANWKCQNWHIEIKDPDIVAFEYESNRIFKFLEGRKIEHLVYAGTATNYCVLWSRNTSMYNMYQLFKGAKIQLYIARDLTDSCYVPDSNTIETHDVGTVESVGAIEALGFPSILSSDLAVAT